MSATIPRHPESLSAPALSPDVPCRRGPVVVAVRDGDVQRLFRAARAVAGRLHTGVRVITVVPPTLVPDIAGGPVYLPSSAAVEREMLDGVGRLLKEQIHDEIGVGHGWDSEVDSGDPAHVLHDRVSELHASMLVMGLGSHRPLDRLLAAETTLRVVRHASVPVLAIAHDFHKLPCRVVIATDFGPRSALAVEAVLPLLADGATLHLVHVWERSDSDHPAMLAREQRYDRELPARFAAFRGALRVPRGIAIMPHALEGKSAPRLIEFAATMHADLVVAGRRGLNLLTRLMVGSVTTALVRGVTCALLIVPEPPLADLDRMERLLDGTAEGGGARHWAPRPD